MSSCDAAPRERVLWAIPPEALSEWLRLAGPMENLRRWRTFAPLSRPRRPLPHSASGTCLGGLGGGDVEAGFYGISSIGSPMGDGVTGSRAALLDGVLKTNGPTAA